MTESTLTIEVRDHVLLMGLNRPAKGNSFSLQLLHELCQAYTKLEDDPELWCGFLFAHGKHFTTGLDLAEVGPAVASGKALFPEDAVDPLDLMGSRRRNKPVVCAAHGWCITIGVELMLSCDIRVAARDTRFTQMEVKRGIMPFGGATLRFPAIAGWGNAMRYVLTGEEFDAAEAHRMGLIQEIAEPGQQFDVGLKFAQAVAKQAPLAVQAARRNARIAQEEGRATALASLMDEARALMTTQDAMEGLRSFMERREARFTGK